MARAGFYAVQNSDIRFGRDGRWYADDEVIANPRIAALFARHVERRPDGGYMLQIGDERAPIRVDDTPYVITGSTGHDGAIRIEINDGTCERLDPRTLAIGDGSVLYCRIKGGAEPARFLRAAYYQLADHIGATAGGGFVLQLPSGEYPIERR